jgi:DnaJ-class molecular chaperone
MAEDYYKTLGVAKNASQTEIEKAYRELARKYHPDMNPDDKSAKEKFQQVQRAFDVVGNAEKRELYDRYGASFETMGAGAGAGPGRGAGPGGFHFEDVDLSQFFGERFGADFGPGFGDVFRFRQGGRRPGRGGAGAPPARGGDIRHSINIPFGVAVSGGEVQVTVQRRAGKTETIAVKVPPGIEDGKRIRVRGQGDAPPGGGPRGDILLTVRVAPHPCFERRGNNLHLRVPVTLAEGALGAKVDIPTPRGTVTLSVPPKTSSGAKLRVKGHGVAPSSGAQGDLIAEIQIVLPDTLDDEEREAIRRIGERHPQNPRANLRW